MPPTAVSERICPFAGSTTPGQGDFPLLPVVALPACWQYQSDLAQQRAAEAQYILENELEEQYDQIDRERLMGEMFYAGVLAYHAQLESLGGLMAAQMSAECRTNLSVGNRSI